MSKLNSFSLEKEEDSLEVESLETFEISNDIKDYFNEFAMSYILPIFSDFQIELNKATKDKIHEPHLRYKVGLFNY